MARADGVRSTELVKQRFALSLRRVTAAGALGRRKEQLLVEISVVAALKQ